MAMRIPWWKRGVSLVLAWGESGPIVGCEACVNTMELEAIMKIIEAYNQDKYALEDRSHWCFQYVGCHAIENKEDHNNNDVGPLLFTFPTLIIVGQIPIVTDAHNASVVVNS
jgi:hypothetical protein